MTASDRPPLVLASASPRRHELLRQIGLAPDRVAPVDVDEHPQRRELAAPLAKRLALAKARAGQAAHREAYVIGADTVVACGRRILGKAQDRDTAAAYLGMLSGRRHRVVGGVAVVAPDGRAAVRVVTTSVRFKRLTRSEVDAYLDCGEWRGKAGAYGIQGLAGAFVTGLNGSYFNVVGLPLYETVALLGGLGYPWPRSPTRR